MKKVLIGHASAISSVGKNLDLTFQSLLQHKSGIKKINRFDTKNYKTQYAACIDNIESSDNKSSFLNLIDLILEPIKDIPDNTRVITATTKACIDLLGKKNNYLLPGDIPNYIIDKLNLSGSGINISSACASSTIAIIKGAQMIINNRADSVLIICADIVSEFVFSGFSCLNALSNSYSKPFDIIRDGLTLGEGGAAILLVSEDIAKKHSFQCNTMIAGFGIANDATHITAPAKDGRGLILAIEKALNTANVTPESIGAINAHGTGTIYNDLMEIKAFNHIFKDLTIPVNSIKGSIGHCLGGAGGIEAALATLMLKEKILPGTYGLSSPEPEAEKSISPENIDISSDYLMSTNSGFGGTNAALILKREIC